ncbi:hypothetical protein THAOC_07257 [Thalassiosira oceanica]|uniref:Uncharacterized protein n=1 Tax=Thalassiosira oceanica TaxID=159749 RepID=K0TKS3_THAOC|nr:hypothetical protein THAOC_07257 [Thalassiosira oceanica]|eukprot:EJK71322.1 hypothetical protein THAOC_07257 [Thalassiosira oceanica]
MEEDKVELRPSVRSRVGESLGELEEARVEVSSMPTPRNNAADARLAPEEIPIHDGTVVPTERTRLQTWVEQFRDNYKSILGLTILVIVSAITVGVVLGGKRNKSSAPIGNQSSMPSNTPGLPPVLPNGPNMKEEKFAKLKVKDEAVLNWCLMLIPRSIVTHKAASNGHKCACEAEEMDFKIDCENTQAMTDALYFLNANGCTEKGSCDAGTDCEKNYLIVQSHHDSCPKEKIPDVIKDGIHDFDESCIGCDILRAYTKGAPDCPIALCTDTSGEDAYLSLVEKDCASDCLTDECKGLFLTLSVVHDSCPHGVLTDAVERGLNDLEGPCKEVVCNAGGKDEDPLTCTEADKAGHDDHDDHGDKDPTTSTYQAKLDNAVVAGFKPCQDMCIAMPLVEVLTDSVATCMALCYAEGDVCYGIEFFGGQFVSQYLFLLKIYLLNNTWQLILSNMGSATCRGQAPQTFVTMNGLHEEQSSMSATFN